MHQGWSSWARGQSFPAFQVPREPRGRQKLRHHATAAFLGFQRGAHDVVAGLSTGRIGAHSPHKVMERVSCVVYHSRRHFPINASL